MIVKSLIIFSNMAGCLLPGSGQAGELHASLQSPDGRLSWMLHADNRAAHSLKKGNRTVLEPSGLGIVVNGKDLAGGITGWSVKKVKDNVHDTFETRGKYPSASVHFNEYVVSGDNSGLRLRARVFNNGVAFRYEWTEDVQKAPVLNIGEEKTSFAFPEKAVLWTQDAASALGPCEGVWSPSRIADFKKDPGNPRSHVRTMPVAAELPGGGFALIQEAANFNRQWSGIKFSLQDGACRTVYFQDPEGFSAPSSAEMPWRVILVNDDLNGLVRNDVIPSLAPEPDKNLFPEGAKTPWIKPGRSTWTWWDRGNVREEDQYAFVDMASEFGWEYHLVDEGWKKWGKTVPESMDKVAQLASYAAGKQVGIWVWVRWSDVNNPANDWESMRSFFSSLAKTGIKGIKIDFMDSASRERLAFYDAVAENLAKNKLMVNFHGANTPTGEERSWPHSADGTTAHCPSPGWSPATPISLAATSATGPSCAALPGPSRWRPISFIRPQSSTGYPTPQTWKPPSRKAPRNGKPSGTFPPYGMRPSSCRRPPSGNAPPLPGVPGTSGTLP